MTPIRHSILFLTLAVSALAQPRIDAVVNAASNAVPPAPSSPIARGAMFITYGANQGPGTLERANSFPLPTTLAGTSIQVTVGGTTVNCIMVYTVASQVAAILPSSTPAGTGTIRLTYNGQTSAAAEIVVVDSNPAIFTLNSQGFGDGIIMFPDYSLVTPTKAAKPGDVLVIWATGLGPVSFPENQPPLVEDMPSLPLEVWIGGKRAQVQFRGRNSCCAGLDQINAVIPEGVTGCGTQVILKSGGIASSPVTLALSDGSANCTLDESYGGLDVQTILSRGVFRSASVGVQRYEAKAFAEILGVEQSFTTRGDTGFGGFNEISGDLSALLNQTPDFPAVGQCLVYPAVPQTILPPRQLDAGASLSLQGPGGSQTINRGENNVYTVNLGAGTYLSPGSYTVSGTGGADVGSFQSSVNVSPELQWTNMDALRRVPRGSGVEVTWSGGDPNGDVQIQGSSSVLVGDRTVGATFLCRERTSAGRFTVPSFITLQLPATAVIPGPVPVLLPGSLSIAGVTANTNGGPSEIDLFVISSTVSKSQQTVWE